MVYNHDTVVLDGEMELDIPEYGEFGTVIKVNEGAYPAYTGEYVVDPSFTEQTLQTQNKTMLEDVTVNAIEVARTSNPSGGTTVYIGGRING